MSAWLRQSLYTSFGVLWLTGCVWLLLHLFFQTTTEFGVAPHPWQPSLLAVHGVVALIAVFLFGWVAGSHIGAHWERGKNRVSGVTLVALIGVLALTGVGGYYLTIEALRSAAARTHEALGALAIAPALVHWLKNPRGP